MSLVIGHHSYKTVWKLDVAEFLELYCEEDNEYNKCDNHVISGFCHGKKLVVWNTNIHYFDYDSY